MNTHFDRESERLATVVQLANASAETRQALVDEYRARSEAAFAPATLRNYRQIIANFAKWCEQRGLNAAPPSTRALWPSLSKTWEAS